MGHATIEPTGAFPAGSFQSFVLTYTAGYFGIDDTGTIKVVHRFASDMGRPQFDNPPAPNFISVEASNGAILDVRYDGKQNIRPWDKTLFIRVVRGFLREGDQIIIRFGDPRQGSPGMRMQTFCESTFEFKVLVDAFATYEFTELPASPEIAIVPDAPSMWKAVLPTLRRAGESFRLCLKGEDKWGNPSNKCDHALVLRGDVGDLAGKSKDQVEIADGQELGLAGFQPVSCRRALALGTVTVAARVVGHMDMAAVLTGCDMAAQRCRAAALDG